MNENGGKSRNGYLKLPYAALESLMTNDGLSAETRVLAAYLWHWNQQNGAFPSLTALEQRTGLGHRSVITARRKLAEVGFLKRMTGENESRTSVCRFDIPLLSASAQNSTSAGTQNDTSAGAEADTSAGVQNDSASVETSTSASAENGTELVPKVTPELDKVTRSREVDQRRKSRELANQNLSSSENQNRRSKRARTSGLDSSEKQKSSESCPIHGTKVELGDDGRWRCSSPGCAKAYRLNATVESSDFPDPTDTLDRPDFEIEELDEINTEFQQATQEISIESSHCLSAPEEDIFGA